MKRILSLTCLIMLLLTGCGVESTSCKEVVYADNFVAVESYNSNTIYVDKNTKVMYWKLHYTGSDTGITVILNTDGSPMLWEGDLK